MPKLRNVIPKYAKHRGSGQATVTLNGREFYLGSHGSKVSKIAYDRLVAEWLANDRRGETEPDSITVVEVVAAFLKWAKGHYRKQSGRPTGTVENYILAFRILRSHYGKTLAAEFGPKSLKAIQLLLVGEGLSRRTINDRCSAIRKMFRWAVSEELIPPSVHQGLATVSGLQRGRTKAKESKPVRPVDDARVDAAVGRLPEVVADNRPACITPKFVR